MDYSINVIYVRKLLNMNQSQFALELGVCKSTIVRWESGLYKISKSNIDKFTKYCKDKNIKLIKE